MRRFVLLLLLAAGCLFADAQQIFGFKENPTNGNLAMSTSKGFFVEKNSNCYFIATGHAVHGSVNTQILMQDKGIKLKDNDLLGYKFVDYDSEDWAIYKIDDTELCKGANGVYKELKEGDKVYLDEKEFFFNDQKLENGKYVFKPSKKAKNLTVPGDSGKPLVNKNGEVVAIYTNSTEHSLAGTLWIEGGDLKHIFSSVNIYEQSELNQETHEALQDITGAWEGQCEVGTTFDNPFEDPMKLLSYAMMTYSSAADGSMDDTLGTNMQESIQDAESYVTSSFDTGAETAQATQEATQSLQGAYDSGSISLEEFQEGLKSIHQGSTQLTETGGGIWGAVADVGKELDDLDVIDKFKNPFFKGHMVTIRLSDILSTALSVIDLDEDKMQKADQFMKSWMGDPGTIDQNAQAYASCMASVGLSFPNVVSASINDDHGASPALNMPWDKPLRLSKKQLELLVDATSESYADTAYRIVGQSGNLYSVIAWDSTAYQQAGQVLCAGSMSKAMNVRQSQLTDTLNPGGQSQGQQIGMAVARMLIQNFVPPPYNIIATMVFDVITSIGSIDACNNMEDAMQHGSLKVMQHKNFNQCYKTGSDCAEKWFWGDCMRDRNYYCCFSTIETRIAAQGVNQQLCRDNSSCGGIGIGDLKKISFAPCEDGQDPCTDKCFPRDKYAEFFNQMTKGASKDMEGDMDGVMNQIKDMMSTEKGICE